MKKHWTRSGIMNAAGFALLISAAAVSVVVYLLRYDQLWLWYKVYQEKLLEAEQFIQSLGISWKFVLAMLIVFLVRTFIPFLSVSAICVLTGVVLPSYWALIVNFLGIIIMMSIKYFEGMKFGSGNAWKIISKNERARKIIESSGKVNKALLLPCALSPDSRSAASAGFTARSGSLIGSLSCFRRRALRRSCCPILSWVPTFSIRYRLRSLCP